MTVELEGYPDTEREIGFNSEMWFRIRGLAERLGWQPEGASHEPDGPIVDDYALNNFQYVSARDARNMADALKQADKLIFGDDPELSKNRRIRYLALCGMQHRYNQEHKLLEKSLMGDDWETCGKQERKYRREIAWMHTKWHNEELQVFSDWEVIWYTTYKKIQRLISFLDKGGYRIY